MDASLSHFPLYSLNLSSPINLQSLNKSVRGHEFELYHTQCASYIHEARLFLSPFIPKLQSLKYKTLDLKDETSIRLIFSFVLSNQSMHGCNFSFIIMILFLEVKHSDLWILEFDHWVEYFNGRLSSSQVKSITDFPLYPPNFNLPLSSSIISSSCTTCSN